MKKITAFLNECIDYCRRHLYLSIFVILAALLGSAFVLRKLTPTQAERPSIISPVLSELRTTQFKSTQIEPPSQYPTIAQVLPVYVAFPKTIDLQRLLSSLDLQKSAYPDRYENEKLHRVLSYNSSTRIYEYSDSLIAGDSDPALNTKMNPTQAIESANTFLKGSLGLESYTPVKTGIRYYRKQDAEEAEPIEANDSNVAEIPFTLPLEGKDSYVGTTTIPAVTIFIDSTGKVLSFRMLADQFTVGSKETVPTVAPDKIVEQLKTGKAEILQMFASTTDQFQLQNIQKLKINDITYQYRFVPSSQLAVPYYYVDGIVSYTSDLDPMRIVFTLPAVRTSAK